MTASIAQYAALAEWIYARNNVDQPLQLPEISAGAVAKESKESKNRKNRGQS